MVPTSAGQATAREVLRDLLAKSDSATLVAAAEEAAAGPEVRARRLVSQATELLGKAPVETEGDAADAALSREHWTLQLEGVLREIDAGFAAESRPDALSTVRAQLVAAVQAP